MGEPENAADMKEEESGLSSALPALSEDHAKKVMELISGLPDAVTREPTDADAKNIPDYLAERSLEKFSEILGLYQEQPHLLDPQLPQMLRPLLAFIRDRLSRLGAAAAVRDALVRFSFLFIANLSRTRGYKPMLRQLPHEVSDVETVVSLLEEVDPADGAFWAHRAVLLLWLLLLIKIPFQLSRFDSPQGPTLLQRLLPLAQRYSASFHEASSAVAAQLHAAILARHDLKAQLLAPALTQAFQELSHIDYSSDDEKAVAFQVLGITRVIASVLKHGPREDLKLLAPSLLNSLLPLPFQRLNNPLAAKMRLKLLQRIGLLFLRPKPGAWRYRRGARSLAVNLAQTPSLAPSAAADAEETGEEEDVEVAEEVETVIQELLGGLEEKDGFVRWSAAKGLGRVASRLGREQAEDVVGGILSLVEEGGGGSESGWHGACLALAELGRRGALLPRELSGLEPVLGRALFFEQPAGRYSVGGQVRDAACFLAWSFARTFEPGEMRRVVEALAARLVCVALFDRELHCRRAASAAFQENVGRQGNFPAGLEIIDACDYHAVGQLPKCYTQLAPFVAQFQPYRRPLFDALLTLKVPHWDPKVRKLAATSLGLLTPREPELMVEMVMEKLIPMAVSRDLFARQGSLFAIGEVISALLGLEGGAEHVSGSLMDRVSGIPGETERLGLVRGLGSEWVRAGLNALMGQLAGVSVWRLQSVSVLEEWVSLLRENLHHADKDVREGAARVWSDLGSKFAGLDKDGALAKRLVVEAVEALGKASVEMERQAAALFLSNVGLKFLGPEGARAAMSELTRVSVATGEGDKSWAEARQDCLAALSSLLVQLRETGSVTAEQESAVAAALLAGCNDYTLDTRGDIGKVVRETAMLGLRQFFVPVAPALPSPELADLLSQSACKLVQQSCEKIDLTRKIAAESLGAILRSASLAAEIPERDLLLQTFLTKTERQRLGKMCKGEEWQTMYGVKWMSASETFPRLSALLSSPSYRYSAVLGMVVSAGGLTESTMKAASSALIGHAEAQLERGSTGLLELVEVLGRILRDHVGVGRVEAPLMTVVEKLLSSGALESLAEEAKATECLSNLLALSIQVTHRKKSPARVLAGVGVACGFLQFGWGGELAEAALAHCVRALAHVYPRVRHGAAAQMYEALLTYAALDNHSEQLLGLLSNTDWDRDLADLKPTRRLIADLLRLPDPLPPQIKPTPLC